MLLLALGNNMENEREIEHEGDGLGLARALVYLVPVSIGFWLGVIWYFMR